MAKYKSKRREMQAAKTREDIVHAARVLFARNGYSGTSVEDIAREAGVAVQTIYSSLGSKRGILRDMNDLIDEEAGVGEMLPRMASAQDPEEILWLAVRIPRQFNERCGDILATLIGAQATEPEMAEINAEGARRHSRGERYLAERLKDYLAPGLTLDRAAQYMEALTWVPVWMGLRDNFGMSFDEAEEWIFGALHMLVLGTPAPARD